MDKIKFEEWEKFDFRIAEIVEAKEHPDADKLLVLKVKIGNEKRQLVAGIKGQYELEELEGKKVVVFTNLEPVELRGVKSDGMVLAAVDNDKVSLLIPENDVESGSKIS